MNETIISWNVGNWITVCLMAFLGFAIVGLITTTVKSARGAGNEAG